MENWTTLKWEMFEAAINKKEKEERKVERVFLPFEATTQSECYSSLFFILSLSLFEKLKEREVFYFKDPNFDNQNPQNSDQKLWNSDRGKEKKCRAHRHLDQMKTMRVSMLTVKVDITPLESETNSPVAVTSLRESLVGDNSQPFGLPMILALLYASLLLSIHFIPLISFYHANKILNAEF